MEEKSALITHACAFCQRPGCITPAEFFHYLKERIDLLISNPNGHFRLAFWDLTQMDYRFPLFREDKMLLPALMDMFKTKKLKSLLMGAGNAENTKAASAMADHVLFCWRSPSVPNLNIKETDYKANSHSSLMLYVDRTSAASHHAGKALYCIPIMYDNSRNDDKLIIPRVKDDLIKHLIPLSSKELKRYDLEMIENITNMQGVS